MRAGRIPLFLPGTAPDAPRRNALAVLGYLLGVSLVAETLSALL
ncbi:hypothetical protein [Halobellus limi]|nr:hypothetical protein [Halobellus limi]